MLAEDAFVEVAELQVAHQPAIHCRVFEHASEPAAVGGGADTTVNGASARSRTARRCGAESAQGRDVVTEHRDDLTAYSQMLIHSSSDWRGPGAPEEGQQRLVVALLGGGEGTGQETGAEGEVGAQRQAAVESKARIRIGVRRKAHREVGAAREPGMIVKPRLEPRTMSVRNSRTSTMWWSSGRLGRQLADFGWEPRKVRPAPRTSPSPNTSSYWSAARPQAGI